MNAVYYRGRASNSLTLFTCLPRNVNFDISYNRQPLPCYLHDVHLIYIFFRFRLCNLMAIVNEFASPMSSNLHLPESPRLISWSISKQPVLDIKFGRSRCV
ncbi:hypothetical protein PO909_021047 [Leuciscus waleckii]